MGRGADFMYNLINVSKGKVSMYISERPWMESFDFVYPLEKYDVCA